MAEEKKQGFDGLVSLDHYPTREDVEALDALGLFKGTKLEKAQYPIKAAALASSLIGGPARAGFDPNNIESVEGLAKYRGLGGVYSPGEDRIIADPEHPNAFTHESMHRGLKLMKDDGKIGGKGDYEKASKDDLEKQVWRAKNDYLPGKDSAEELLVRGLMKHTAGDPEHSPYANELKPAAEKLYNPGPDDSYEDRKFSLKGAPREIDRRSMQMLVERMKEGEQPWFMDRPEPEETPIPQRKPVPAFAAGGLVGSGMSQNTAISPATPAFAAGGMMASPPPETPPADVPPSPPPGALPEEVADDVDAKLSRGEYVIPADVVRFMGLEQIEKIIGKAKQGLMAMQEQGRIQDAPPPEAAASPADGPPAPAPAPLPPAPQTAPSGPPGFAAGGMVGDIYSRTYNDYQQQAGNIAPTIETYTDENGRLAYRYVDAKGRPVAQPKIKAPGLAGTAPDQTPAATETQPASGLTNPGTIAPVAPGMTTGKSVPGDGGSDGQSDRNSVAADTSGWAPGRQDALSLAASVAPGALGLGLGAMNGLAGIAAGTQQMAAAGLTPSFADYVDAAFGTNWGGRANGIGGYGNLGVNKDLTDLSKPDMVGAMNYADPGVAGPARAMAASRVRAMNNALTDPTIGDVSSSISDMARDGFNNGFGGRDNSLGDDPTGGYSVGDPSSLGNPSPSTSYSDSFSAGLGNFGGVNDGFAADGSISGGVGKDSLEGNTSKDSLGTSGGGWGGGYTSESPGTAGGGGGADGNNGAGGSSDSRVICTHFFLKGELSRDLWVADTRWTMEHVSKHIQRGYHIWGIPYVRLMRKSKLAEAIMRPLALNRAEEIGYKLGMRDKPSLSGKFGRLVLEGISWIAGFLPVEPESYKKLYS